MSRMKQCVICLIPVLTALAGTGAAQAEPRQFAANGHYYEIVWVDRFNWRMARAAAEMRTHTADTTAFRGHLATITSLEEDAFVSSLLPAYDRANWAVYLGGFQAPGSEEPGGGWQWVTGEPFVYANWAEGQPNDGYGTHEDVIMYHGPALCPGGGSAVTIQWNDARDTRAAKGFVVEYETAAISGTGWEAPAFGLIGGDAGFPLEGGRIAAAPPRASRESPRRGGEDRCRRPETALLERRPRQVPGDAPAA